MQKQKEIQKISSIQQNDEGLDSRQRTLMEFDEEEPIIALVGKLGETTLFFEVHDNGVGVSDEITKKCFLRIHNKSS